MFRPASRLVARSTAARVLPRAAPPRRYASTNERVPRPRSWKNLGARFALATALTYFYMTQPDVFAEEPKHAVHALPETEDETEQLPTIEAIAQERQQRKAEATKAQMAQPAGAQETAGAGDVEGLEEEADQQGAFNPETGEINWDCPCLGGMAHGPCGEQFKAAFSCFVYSTEEPKGVECIEKFKDMQNCFREYPEVYGSELDPEEEDNQTADQPAAADSASKQPSDTSSDSESQSPGAGARQERAKAATAQVEQEYGDGEKDKSAAAKSTPSASQKSDEKERANAATEQVKKEHPPQSESDSLLPKAAHDATAANSK